MTTQVVTTSDLDIFADEVMEDPYPHYKQLRDTSPVVFLQKYEAFAVARHADVRDALQNWQTFSSESLSVGGTTMGPGFNSEMNARAKGIVIAMDPPEHAAVRSMMHEHLRLDSVREMTANAEQVAARIVAELVERGSFDGATDLANQLVPSIVGQIIGVRDPAFLPTLVAGSAAAFSGLGPMNAKAQKALRTIDEMLGALSGVSKDGFLPGSIGHELFEAAERGEISPAMVMHMLWAYISPGFDTTITAMSNTLHLLATHPSAWEALTSDPSLVPAVINEGLRYDAPIQIWARHTVRDADVDGQTIPSGSRVAVVLGSANRDERHYPNPDRFDIGRPAQANVAFGFGVHTCLGAPLARIELAAMLKALIKNGVHRIELNGTPKRFLNQTVRGFESLPLAVRR